MDELENKTRELNQAMDDVARDAMMLGDQFEKTAKQSKTAEQRLQDFANTTRDVGRQFGRIGRDFDQNKGKVGAFGSTVELAAMAGAGLAKKFGVAGAAADLAADALMAVANITFEEVDRTIENFDKMGKVGAISAGGLEEFRTTSHRARLTMEQFASVVSNNANNLAIAAGNTLTGSRAISELAEAAGESGLRLQLSMLGQTVEEQSEYFGNYLFLQRRIGRAAVTDFRSQSAAAGEFAKQLQLLSALTGKSVKEEQAALDAQLRNQRFRFALQQATDPAEIQAAMRVLQERLGPISDGLMDAFSGPNTDAAKEAIVTFGRVPGGLMPLIESFKRGEISAGEFTQEIYKAGKQFKTELGPTLGLVADAGGQLGGAASQALIGIEQIGDIDPELFARLRQEIESLASGSSEMTERFKESALNSQDAAVAAESMRDIFLGLADPILPGFTGAVLKATEALNGLSKLVFKLDGEKATGGPVTGGGSYLVGENGPEIFSPNNSGFITDTTATRQYIASREEYAKQMIQQLFSDPHVLQDGFETALGETIRLVQGGAGGVKISGVEGASYYDTQGNFIKHVMPVLVEGMRQTLFADGSQSASYTAGGINMQKNFNQAGELLSRNLNSAFGGLNFMSTTDYTGMAGPRTSYSGSVTADGFTKQVGYGTLDAGAHKANGGFDTPALRELFEKMSATMANIEANTRTGADTSKKLLRATAG